MKIRRSRKALSPVVASIILIAVTVAVSIAVAAWMGALTFNFMGSSSLTITNVDFNGTSNTTSNKLILAVKNTGTRQVTVSSVKVNNLPATIDASSVTTVSAGNTTSITLDNIGWIDGNTYKIDLFDASAQGVGSTQQNAPGA